MWFRRNPFASAAIRHKPSVLFPTLIGGLVTSARFYPAILTLSLIRSLSGKVGIKLQIPVAMLIEMRASPVATIEFQAILGLRCKRLRKPLGLG
jgi:hypothetical protein